MTKEKSRQARFFLLIVVRRRWVNEVLLAAGLVYYGWQVPPVRFVE